MISEAVISLLAGVAHIERSLPAQSGRWLISNDRWGGSFRPIADTNLLSAHFGHSHLVRVQLPLRVGTHSEPEPDLGLLDKSLALGLVGHPTCLDLVLEVANTSLAYHRCEKLKLYARAQVPEYWIVNVGDQWVEVYRDPQGDGYHDHFQRGPGEFLELLRLPGPRLAVSTLLGHPDVSE